ncbi:uncharacterized protein ddias [Esox lucius]|uniref:uncharacterized protein ddias n=1 Tax=Esox lucius TaxID=8010 RepID=UPI0014774C4F|nr:uncharacterized protein ddias [Esox lucius]
MSVRRALVDCAVLSLQDQCVLYPCCRGCFSRVLRTDTTWWRCSRCGYRCLEQHLDYRYRLSLRVTRGNTIFGLTVFGSCLNPLFGAKATDLHRLVEESLGEEGQRLGGHSRLLVKAVEDCFIGRHFVFGIKLSGSLPPGTESGSQFIASQISLPLAAAPGCSVVSYYRTLLHQAALGPAWISDPGPAPQSIANTNGAPLLLPPSTEGSFNSTLPACGGSLSLHCSFTRTPTYTQTVPWQQSPGVITSSAEQEEECSFQGGEKGRERGLGEVPGRLKIPGVSGRLISPFSLPQPPCQEEGNNRDSYWDVLSSFCEVPDSPVPSPASLTWAAPMQPSHRQAVPSSARKRGVPETECLSESHLTDLADHVPWEDLPFSESLGEFVCNPADTDPETDHQNRSTTLTEPIPMLPRTLLDITNVEGVTHGGLSPQSQEHKHSADLEEEEDDYNCSADLFHYADNSTDTHTPHVDGHTDTHPPHVDGHTDTSTPVSRRTAPLHSLQLRAQRHTPRALTHTPRALRQEPRNSLRAWQRIFGGALKRTAESRRGSSLGEESDMVPPSPAAPCSLRSTGSSRRRISGVKGSEGGSYLRTKGGAQMRAASSLTNRQHADWERHVPHTLTDRQTNQCQTPSCPSLQEKKVSDWSSDPEIEGCDWSRDMFDDSF